MTRIIVSGHGNFASGLKTSIELITGEQEMVKYVDFNEHNSVETLEKNIRATVDTLGNSESILFLTDLVGGSPFKTSAIIAKDLKGSAVVGGVNVPMLLELLFIRTQFTAKELAEKSVAFGKNGIKVF